MVSLLVIGIFCISGCDNSNGKITSLSPISNGSATFGSSQAGGEGDNNVPDVYKPVIQQYIDTFAADQAKVNKESGGNSNDSTSIVPYINYYAIKDIDNDGVDELFVGYSSYSPQSQTNISYGIDDIWTISHGKPVKIYTNGQYYAQTLINSTGEFAQLMSPGTAIYTVYKIDSDKGKASEICTLKIYYIADDAKEDLKQSVAVPAYSITGTDGVVKEISEKDFYDKLDAFAFTTNNSSSLLNWIPFPGQEGKRLGNDKTNSEPAFPYAVQSSKRASIGNVTYDATNVLDGNFSTAWCEGVSGPGIGEWVELRADDLQHVSKVFITNGYCKSEEVYTNNNSISVVTITGEDGFKMQVPLKKDILDYQEIDFAKPIDTSWLRFTITDVYPGSKDNEDTLISDIKVE